MPELYQVLDTLNRSESKPALYIDERSICYAGDESTPGILRTWRVLPHHGAGTINPRYATGIVAGQQGLLFVHVTKAANIMAHFKDRPIIATGDDKELGPGFYTMAADTLTNGECSLLGREWFEKKQSEPNWSVLGIRLSDRIPSWFLEAAGGGYRGHLLFYLTRSIGHPSGKPIPDASDKAIMEQINFRGKVLILPDDDSPVSVSATNANTYRASDIAATQGANLPGDPWVVIGPQKPAYMHARQIAWKYGAGLWMINSSERAVLFNHGSDP